MAEAKGLVYQGVDNTGYATVLDKAQDPAAVMQPLMNQFLNREWDKVKKAEADKKLRDASVAKLQNIVPKWDKTKDIRGAEIDSLINTATGYASSNIDPNTVPEFLKMQRDVEFNIQQDDLARQALAKMQQQYQTGKFDDEVYSKFIDELEQADPKDMASIVLNSTALMPKTDWTAGMSDFQPEGFVSAYENEQGVTTTTDKLDPAVATEQSQAYLVTRVANDPDFIEKGVIKGLWDSAEGAEKYYEKQFQNSYKESRKTTRESGGGGGLTMNFGGGGATVGDYKMSFANEPGKGVSDPNKPWEVNTVGMTYKDQDVRPLALTEKGETVYVKPERIVKKPDVEGSKWYIEGKVAKRLTGDQLQAAASKSNKGMEAFATDEGYEFDPSTDTYVSIKETRTVLLPISKEQGKEGEDNYNTLSTRLGEDIETIISKAEQQRKAEFDKNPKKIVPPPSMTPAIDVNAFKKLGPSERMKYKKNADGTYSLK